MLTKLKNRGLHVDELNRLGRRQAFPVTVTVTDLNNLKKIAEELGRGAGDASLRRVGLAQRQLQLLLPAQRQLQLQLQLPLPLPLQ